MKILFCVLAAGILLGGAGVRADLTVVQTVEGLELSMRTTTRYKDGKTRLDTEPGGVSIIVDTKTGETLSLRHAEKAYIRAPSSVVQAAVDSMKPPGGSPTPAPALKATGRRETISGFPAAEYVLDAGGGARFALWLTHDIPDYGQAMKELAAAYTTGPLAVMLQTRGLDMTHLPGFPVRIVNEVQPGNALTSTTVSVSLAPVADDLFTAPADYKEIKVPVLTPPAAVSAPSPAGH